MQLLIVEDDTLTALSMDQILAAEGHTIIGLAADVNGALKLAATVPFDLALVDYHLAGDACGADAIQLLRRLYGRPSIFVSSNPDQCRRAWKAAGALGCLRKPFDERMLVKTVAAAELLIAGQKPEPVPQGFEIYAD